MCVEVPHLRYIVAAADHCSFRRAAAALNITQPTLSKRIQELEGRLGVPLFERSSSGAQLTAIGEEFVVSARRVLAELRAMESRAKAGKRGNAGRLEIGFYTSLSTGALIDNLLTFVKQHPNVEVNITEGARATLIPLLDRGAIDIVVVLGEVAHTNFAHLSLWSERLMVAFPKDHPLAKGEFVYWTDLKRERFLMSQRDPGPEIQDMIINKLTSPGDRPLIKSINAHREDVLSAVNGNRGITLTCESSTGAILSNVVFREVRDGNGPTRVGYVAYWRHSNDNPALKQLLALLQAKPAVPSAIGSTSTS
ncbi:LysR substrate-binding domain-containing protein [Pseudolabrys sp.]|uniref:LysR substrate-binding domain-containing protein n=1 Tax=Pseudolabrys sp. TaxID=1960880 RepID=UPI003D14C0DD